MENVITCIDYHFFNEVIPSPVYTIMWTVIPYIDIWNKNGNIKSSEYIKLTNQKIVEIEIHVNNRFPPNDLLFCMDWEIYI